MAERRRYNAKTRAVAVGMAEVEGQTETARKTGIPLTTINQWFHRPEFVGLRTTKREDVEHSFWAGIQVGLKAVVQGLSEPARLSEKAIALGILYDKYALLSGGVTERTENRDMTEIFDDHETRAIVDAAREYVGRAGSGEGERLATEATVAPTGATGPDTT